MIKAIIGANFGDEGKGLAVNHFSKTGKNLIIRHNGGSQSGHTVETNDKKFVFHSLSSGSFNNCDTYWADTYHPDLYVLDEEWNSFYKLTDKAPVILCSKDVKITIIDDVLLNCFKESQYKDGSCGMGIWECVCRNNAGYPITIETIMNTDTTTLFQMLKNIRKNYTIPRLLKYTEKYHTDKGNDYKDMLFNDNVLANYIAKIKENIGLITIIDDFSELLDKYDSIIFENGQGLLIDGDLDIQHGTPSKTGLYNINQFLKKYDRKLDEVIYVTRTYLTRHGRGNFVNEADFGFTDETNKFNEWQEGIRYGKFTDIQSLVDRIHKDCPNIKPHLLVTHANLTDEKMLTEKGDIDIYNLPFEKIYISDNKTSVNSKLLQNV